MKDYKKIVNWLDKAAKDEDTNIIMFSKNKIRNMLCIIYTVLVIAVFFIGSIIVCILHCENAIIKIIGG